MKKVETTLVKDFPEDFVVILKLTIHNLKFENMLKQNEEGGGAQRLYELRKEPRATLMDVDPNFSEPSSPVS
jgi:hypothetical protein